ncbi:MAG: phage minor head protein [Pseudomonadota bacterium]
MGITETRVYQKAFQHYLRHGTPIELSLKAMMHEMPLYIWHTQGDDKVRSAHAANDGKIFAWAHPPSTANPGEEPGCRCWAESVEVDTTPLDILALLSGAGLVRRVGMRIVRRVGEGVIRRVGQRNEAPSSTVEPQLNDTRTWPKPPREGRFKEADPSRSKPRARGEKSLYDKDGGEWRYAPEDKYHNAHWDYKPAGEKQAWQNIKIDNKPILKQ